MAYSSALLKAINAVLVDPSFSTGSAVAADALHTAKTLQEWCVSEENDELVKGFTSELLGDLQGALVFPHGRRTLNRERIWQQFFTVHSSSGFISRWTAFLEQASANPTPTLYQHLTDIIFRELMKEHYVIPSSQSSTMEGVSTHNADSPWCIVQYECAHVIRFQSRLQSLYNLWLRATLYLA